MKHTGFLNLCSDGTQTHRTDRRKAHTRVVAITSHRLDVTETDLKDKSDNMGAELLKAKVLVGDILDKKKVCEPRERD